MEDTFDIRNNRDLQETEHEFENALRPLSFSSFSGQGQVVENLKILSVLPVCVANRWIMCFCTDLRIRKNHPFNIIANELGVGFKITSVPFSTSQAMAGILTSLEPNDVLFIDEIHRLAGSGRVFVQCNGGCRIDILIDKGPSARSIKSNSIRLPL